MARLAAQAGVGPRVLDAFVCRARRGRHHGVIVMQHVTGPPLRQWLRAASPRALRAMRGRLETLIERMHAASLYHNDLHTGNVVVTRSGAPVLVDFGAASAEARPRWAGRGGRDGRHRDFDVLDDLEAARATSARRGDDLEGRIVRHVARRLLARGVVRVATGASAAQ